MKINSFGVFYVTSAAISEDRSAWGTVSAWWTTLQLPFPKWLLLNHALFTPVTTEINKSQIRACNSVCGGGLCFIFVIVWPLYFVVLSRKVNIIRHKAAVDTVAEHFWDATGKHAKIKKKQSKSWCCPKKWLSPWTCTSCEWTLPNLLFFHITTRE